MCVNSVDIPIDPYHLSAATDDGQIRTIDWLDSEISDSYVHIEGYPSVN
jgi:hypothetical protein